MAPRVSPPGAVDQNVAHRFSAGPKEVLTILERHSVIANQTQPDASAEDFHQISRCCP